MLSVLVTALSHPANAQDFPRQGYEGAPNGLAAPFAGQWGMKFPEPEGTIVSAIIVSCDDPIRIEAVDDTHISYGSPGREPALFEVFAFEGRTTWAPPTAETYIAVWLDPDSFHLHRTEMGRADWADPRLYFRCES
ncbi:hypothetical protein SAMN02983003_1243 [Devosia enhydra]|uniref:Uncharacterized protein n=2 Tax=Devosia enhydra TaxID=665118 RepID=A0A1K2HW08_9HYPH|nr:hypothetical protein SAMN02983003_1243 [Devosia enhydra]